VPPEYPVLLVLKEVQDFEEPPVLMAKMVPMVLPEPLVWVPQVPQVPPVLPVPQVQEEVVVLPEPQVPQVPQA